MFNHASAIVRYDSSTYHRQSHDFNLDDHGVNCGEEHKINKLLIFTSNGVWSDEDHTQHFPTRLCSQLLVASGHVSVCASY